MLERWLEAAVEEAGARGVDPTLLTAEAVDAVLELARHAAHGVERPAAPLAAFAAGLALGPEGGIAELRAVVERVSELAGSWTDES